jgi:hypothetical protein
MYTCNLKACRFVYIVVVLLVVKSLYFIFFWLRLALCSMKICNMMLFCLLSMVFSYSIGGICYLAFH